MRRPLRICGDARGATLVEFAFIFPILLIALLGMFDLGHQFYARAVLNGALGDVARIATVGKTSGADIDASLQRRLKPFASGQEVTIAKKSYSEYAKVKRPETITTDTAPLNQYNASDCFEDANGNGTYDTDRGKSGLGGADDIINYEVTMTYPRITPMSRMLGWNSNVVVRASIPVRNQPFAAQQKTFPIVCPAS